MAKIDFDVVKLIKKSPVYHILSTGSIFFLADILTPGIDLKYTWTFQLKSKIMPIFDHFDRELSVCGTIITNLTENGTYYAIFTLKRTIQ